AFVSLVKVQGKLLATLPDLSRDSDRRKILSGASDVLSTWARAGGGANYKGLQIMAKMMEIGLAIVNGRPETEAELKKILKPGMCFIATAVCGEESVEVDRLRRFRDEVLRRTLPGRAFIAVYET